MPGQAGVAWAQQRPKEELAAVYWGGGGCGNVVGETKYLRGSGGGGACLVKAVQVTGCMGHRCCKGAGGRRR